MSHPSPRLRWVVASFTWIVGLSGMPSQAGPAHPPETPTTRPSAAASLEPRTTLAASITVTAEKVEQDIQTVPVAVTALTGAELDRSGIESTLDLGLRTPGLVMSSNATLAQPYIRGIGSDFLTIGSDSSVAMHLDGVYLARPAAAAVRWLDVDRVEVLRGPQGTLYGRNATGGSINVHSNQPTADPTAQFDLQYASFDEVRLRAVVNSPLGDRVSARLAVLNVDRDGFTTNLEDRTELDDDNTWAARGAVHLQLSEALELTLLSDYLREQSTRGTGLKLTAGMPPALDLGATNPRDPRKVHYDVRPDVDVEQWGASAQLRWDLGSARLQSITAFRVSDWRLLGDVDATEVPMLHQDTTERSEWFTQELQLTGQRETRHRADRPDDVRPDHGVQWLAGLFYLQEKADYSNQIFLPLFGVASSNPQATSDNDAWAAYGQASIPLADRWRATVGLRYSDETKRHDLDLLLNGAVLARASDSDSWDAYTTRLGLAYDVAAEVLLYGALARGFKSGGFNSLAIQDAFEPEFVWSYEAGLKATALEHRLRANLSGFYYDYTDIQVNQTLAGEAAVTTSISNAAAATLKGLEVELMATPANGLDLELSVALLDTRFDEYTTLDPDDPTRGRLDLAGNSLVRAPELSAMLAVQYARYASDLGLAVMRAEYLHQGRTYFNVFNERDVSQAAFGIANARLLVGPTNGRWTVELFGENLTDELYAQNILEASIVGSLSLWGPPRSVGARVAVRWD